MKCEYCEKEITAEQNFGKGLTVVCENCKDKYLTFEDPAEKRFEGADNDELFSREEDREPEEDVGKEY
jgi:hypothetical protein